MTSTRTRAGRADVLQHSGVSTFDKCKILQLGIREGDEA